MLHHAAIGYDFAFYSGVATPGRGAWEAALGGWPFMLPLAGNYAVCVFFALSGYVLASSFRRTELGAVALTVKRAVRLGIPILAVTLFAWALWASGLIFSDAARAVTQSWWLGRQNPPEPGIATALSEGFYGALLGLPDATAYDSSLWTMSIEFAGSLLLIAVFVLLRPFRRRDGSETVLVIAFLILGALGCFLYLCLFAFGAALRLSNLRGRLERFAGLGWIMAALLMLGVFLGTLPYAEARGPWIGWLAGHALVGPNTGWQADHGAFSGIPDRNFWHAAGALLTLVAVDNWPALRGLLNRTTPQFLGRISFPLYLLHVPVLLSLGCGIFLALLHAGLPPGPAWTVGAALAAATACLLAWAATPVIEESAVSLSASVGRFSDSAMGRLRAKISGRPAPVAPQEP